MGNLIIPTTTTTTTSSSDRFDLNSYPLSGQLMFYTVLALSGILAFLFCFYFYTRYLELRNHFLRRRHRHRHHPPSAELHTHQIPNTTASRPRRGLDRSLLKSLPTFTYAAASDPDDCSVCLSEFEKGDLARLLPGCGHVFHADCIDLWFRSHSNCPLCRAAVEETDLDPADLVAVTVVVPEPAAGVDERTESGRFGSDSGSVRSGGRRVARLNPVECRRKSLDLADVLLLTELNSPLPANRVGLLGRSETVDLEAGWIWASGAGTGSGDESGSDSPGSRGSSTLKRFMSV